MREAGFCDRIAPIDGNVEGVVGLGVDQVNEAGCDWVVVFLWV